MQRARTFGKVGEVTIDLVDCERPHFLVWAIGSTGMAVRGTEDLTTGRDGTDVHWVWEFRPRGAMKLLGPMTGVAGRRLERRVWSDMKRHLESTASSIWDAPGDPGNGQMA